MGANTIFRLLSIEAVKNLKRLKTLTLLGSVFRHKDEELKNDFVEALHDLHIEHLCIPLPGAFALGLSTEQLARISDLKSIEYFANYEDHYLVPLFLGLLPNSMSSLTTLSLWGNKHDEWVIGGLYALRFPHLRSLTLDMWDSESHPPSGFNDFISAHHHNLELLNLEYSRWDSIALLLDERMGLGPDFLPTLRAFRGHSRNVEMMANTDMACLSNLTKLGVGAGGIYGPLDALNQMFGAIRTHLPLGRMSCLKELHFDIHGWRSNDENDILAFRYEIPTFIQRWGEICGPTLDLARLAAPRVVVVGRRTGRSTRPVSQAAGN